LAKVRKYIKKLAISVDMYWNNWIGNILTYNLGMSGYANTALFTDRLHWWLLQCGSLLGHHNLSQNFTDMFSNYKIIALATIWCSLFDKANAVYNPILYGIREGIINYIKWGQCLKFLSASYSPWHA
jgi:hypothetical protein